MSLEIFNRHAEIVGESAASLKEEVTSIIVKGLDKALPDDFCFDEIGEGTALTLRVAGAPVDYGERKGVLVTISKGVFSTSKSGTLSIPVTTKERTKVELQVVDMFSEIVRRLCVNTKKTKLVASFEREGSPLEGSLRVEWEVADS